MINLLTVFFTITVISVSPGLCSEKKIKCNTDEIADSIMRGNIEMIKTCPQNWKSWNYQGSSILHLAVGSESLHAVNEVLKLSLNLNFKNDRGQTALEMAQEMGNQPIVKRLQLVTKKSK